MLAVLDALVGIINVIFCCDFVTVEVGIWVDCVRVESNCE